MVVRCVTSHVYLNMYSTRFLPPDREVIVVRGGRGLRVKCLGSIDINSHGYTDIHHTLFHVSYVPD